MPVEPGESAGISRASPPMQLPCPACSAATEHHRLFVKNGCDVLQCSTCGLGRTLARDFAPERYYTEDYFSGVHADGYADYRGSEHILRREFAHTVRFIRKFRDGGRLLDVGCAYGFFLKEAQPFYDVSGIEIAADAAAFCRTRGLHTVTGMADDKTLASLGVMDVIVMLDVIEHLPDPRQTLAQCCEHLAPGGIIVITTGDFASLCARLAGRHWRLMTPPQHLWFFTPGSVERLAQSLGLTLEACDHPWKLVPLSLIAFQLRRMVGLKPVRRDRESDIGMPVNLFDAMRCVLRKRHA
jgi:SAM-dependent methyltransferase